MNVIQNGYSKTQRWYYNLSFKNKIRLHGFSSLLITPIIAYIHEGGHALACKTLFNEQGDISLRYWGFFGGACACQLGRKEPNLGINKRHAIALLVAGGPLAQLATAVTLASLGRSPFFTYPAYRCSLGLSLYALVDLFMDTDFCYGHDFCEIRATAGRLPAAMLTAGVLATTGILAKRHFPALARLKKQHLEATEGKRSL